MERLKALFRKRTGQERFITILRRFGKECRRQNYAPHNFYLPEVGFYYHESQVNERLKGVTRH